jgi:hypothetical protein
MVVELRAYMEFEEQSVQSAWIKTINIMSDMLDPLQNMQVVGTELVALHTCHKV